MTFSQAFPLCFTKFTSTAKKNVLDFVKAGGFLSYAQSKRTVLSLLWHGIDAVSTRGFVYNKFL